MYNKTVNLNENKRLLLTWFFFKLPFLTPLLAWIHLFKNIFNKIFDLSKLKTSLVKVI